MLKEVKDQQLPLHLFSKDKKNNQKIQKQHYRKKIAQQRNKISELLHHSQPGFLQPQFQGDQTVKVQQRDIIQSVNVQTAANTFQLDLNMGDYRCEYSQNGSTLMLTSSQGHLTLLDWRQKDLLLQLNLRQKIFDSTFLHSNQMLALAQASSSYIYDSRGIQIHKLPFSYGLQYLPYHFLLSLYDNRHLKYYDTTTGQVIADHIAKNNYSCMTQNKSNAIIAMGTNKGVVQWWTPGIGKPAIQLFVGTKVNSIAFYKGYMYTLADKLKVWDSRTLKLLHQQNLPRRGINLQVSDSGLLALNYGFNLEFYKDLHLQKQKIPYLRHQCSQKYSINNAKFVPFEDLIGLGTSKGFSSLIVPGSGLPYYDTFENNPFQSRKQQRQSLVHKLLEKLPHQTITIDTNVIGNMSRMSKEELELEEKQEKQKKQRQHIQKIMAKNKAKGRSKIGKKISKREIQIDKIKRLELTKVINTKLWAKRAQRKKKQTEVSLIEQMQSQGLGIADLLAQHAKKQEDQ